MTIFCLEYQIFFTVSYFACAVLAKFRLKYALNMHSNEHLGKKERVCTSSSYISSFFTSFLLR